MRFQFYLYGWFILLFSGCIQSPDLPTSSYKHIPAEYGQVAIVATTDSIHFTLPEDTYYKFRVFNLFTSNGHQYISFYDHRSGFLNIYDLLSNQQASKINLKGYFSKSVSYKLTPYIKNFDSIFVVCQNGLYLIDSAGKKINKYRFRLSPANAWPKFDNTCPPLLKDNHLYTAVSAYVDESSLHAIKKWKVMYDFDLSKKQATLLYSYPERYAQKLYGSLFLNQSHCVNEKGNFVLSFPADTSIYETDLKEIHRAYYAKSQYQSRDIPPVSAEALKKSSLLQKDFMTRNFYSSIFYDPYMQRYLRIAYAALTESEYDAKKRVRKTSIIIFDKNFKIIGESDISPTISLKTLFFTPDGGIYARTNLGNEYALDFIRLSYTEHFDNKKMAQNR